MDRVAEPAPALASTTSVPAFWMRSVSFAISSSVKLTVGFVCIHAGSLSVSCGRSRIWTDAYSHTCVALAASQSCPYAILVARTQPSICLCTNSCQKVPGGRIRRSS